MIQFEDLRTYQRQLALYVLSGAGAGGMTAAELCEQMGTASMQSGHPEECWRTLSAASVAGLLKAATEQGLVDRAADRRNTRYGRLEAVWQVTAAAGHPAMPIPCEQVRLGEAPAAALATTSDPLAGLSKAQLIAMVTVGDELSALTAKFMADVEAIKVRARNLLAQPEGR